VILLPPKAKRKNSPPRARQDAKPLKCSIKSKQCGQRCIPKAYKCHISEQELQRIVHDVEDKIKDLPTERAVVIDQKTGRILVSKGGDRTSVFLTVEDLQKMRGNVITHNHPNLGWSPSDPRSKGLSFSPADIQAACIAQSSEMRAVSSGYRHSIKPPPSGWNEQYWNQKVAPSYRRNESQVMNEFTGKILTFKMSPRQADADFHHEVIKRTAAELGMIYKREEIR